MKAVRQHFQVIAICLALVAAASQSLNAAPVRTPSRPNSPALRGPTVLVINQTSQDDPDSSTSRGLQVELFLRHFTPNTVKIAEDVYRAGLLFGFDHVVVVGNDASTPLPAALVHDIAQARRPVLWMGYGIDELPVDMAAELGFRRGPCTDTNLPRWIEYRDQQYPVRLDEYCELTVVNPGVRVLAAYGRAGGVAPYIVRSGDLWYVNGLTTLGLDYPDPESDAPTLIFADILHDFFATQVRVIHRSVIRFEDVSVHVNPARLMAVVDYLHAEGVPFVIGLIPTQLQGGRAVPLSERLDLVRVVRYAQSHGATIALHGYHHTFGSSEDYEFWDNTRDAPLADESWYVYAHKVEDGIRMLRNLGIEPRLWETPHYAASPLAYRVFSSYFSHAIENRDPVSWLPYPAGPDVYGQILIPETLGYIDVAHGLTVEAQLRRARLMRIVRDGYAVGFYHPEGASLPELKALVTGLRELGYSFADLRSLPTQVHFPYRASPWIRLRSWLTVDPGVWIHQLDSWLEGQLDSWPKVWSAARGVPWWVTASVILVLILLVRLPNQWRLDGTSERSLVEPASQRVERGPLLTPQRVWIAVGGLMCLALALLVFPSQWSIVSQKTESTEHGTDERLQLQNWILASAGPPLTPATLGGIDIGSLPKPSALPRITSDWEISVYYTPVESYYSQPPEEVRGCLGLDCKHGSNLLGTYHTDFIQAVKGEGSGRITTGPHAGKFLNWSIDIGYWLDNAPRDARGKRLEPYVSAAADVKVPYGTFFKLLSCGVDVRTRGPMSESVCKNLVLANWIVRDRFTQATVGKRLDLYVGEQDEPDFLRKSEKAIDNIGATVILPSISDGWEVSIYFTTVDRFFSGPGQEVRGCLGLDCKHGSSFLGVYPADFVRAVQGAPGRLTKGPHAGKYINWSIETGFWVDTVPRDAQGQPLRSYVSAAADSSIPFGTSFKILDCGVEAGRGMRLDERICRRLSSATWEVSDRFSEGRVGKRLSLFVGEIIPGGLFWRVREVVASKNARLSLGK